MDVIEATADYPEEARFRWTCEVTGPLERYLDAALAGGDRALPPPQRERRDGRGGDAVQPHAAARRRADGAQPGAGAAAARAPRAADPQRDAGRRQRHLVAVRRPAARDRRRDADARDQPDARAGAQAAAGRVLVGGAGRRAAAVLERAALPVRPQRRQARGPAPRRARPRRARGARRRGPGLPVRLPLRRVDAPDARRQRAARAARERLRGGVERGAAHAADRADDAGRVRRRAARPPRRHAADVARRLDGLVVRRRRLERVRDRAQPHDARAARRGGGDLGVGGRRRSGPPRRPVRADVALRRAHLGRVRLRRAARLAVHQGAVEPQVGLRLRRGDGDARRARARRHRARRARGRAGRRGALQPRRPRLRGGVPGQRRARVAGDQHAAVPAQRARRGARGARGRRAARDARHVLPARRAVGRRPQPRARARGARRAAGQRLGVGELQRRAGGRRPRGRAGRDRERALPRRGRPGDGRAAVVARQGARARLRGRAGRPPARPVRLRARRGRPPRAVRRQLLRVGLRRLAGVGAAAALGARRG